MAPSVKSPHVPRGSVRGDSGSVTGPGPSHGVGEVAAVSMDVVNAGMSSTFQDLGRHGLQKLGVPASGAMDEVSHRVANWLVGNDEHEATLEITAVGPSLRFDRDVVVAVSGAELCAVIDASASASASASAPGGATDRLLDADKHAAVTPLLLNTATLVKAGATLKFGARLAGVRCYLAIAGGFGLPAVMGSRSTYARGGMGGYEGRALVKGDRLTLPLRTALPDRSRAAASPALVDPLDAAANAALDALQGDLQPGRLRAMTGREWAQFDGASQEAFFSESFVVGPQSERMGYRLGGPALRRAQAVDMLSEAVAFGTVQVPNDGQPIVLMADRQSTGGYPRIAQVASVDLPRLAQAMPGEKIRFELVDVSEAQRLWHKRSALLDALRESLKAVGQQRRPA